MAPPSYTHSQLKSLRESPLVQKPNDLPSIEQWFESQPDHNQRRQKGHGGLQGTRSEENDRPLLSTLRTRQSQTGEEVFLGPKISFASASAARQPNKQSPQDPNTAPQSSEFSRFKNERFTARDKTFRDRDGERDFSRFRDKHDHSRPEDESHPDGYQRFRNRRNSQEEDTRPPRPRQRGTQDRDGEGDFGARKNGFGKGGKFEKFEQPWFRDANKTQTADAEDSRISSWRDNRQAPRGWDKGDRPEPEPQWVHDEADDFGEPTQEDFEKWKERMKGGEKPKAEEEQPTHIDTAAPASASTSTPAETPGGESLFGLWADGKVEKNVEGGGPKKQMSSKAKSSRFAGFFAPKDEASALPPPSSPPSQPAAPPSTAEDQAGFEFVMRQLRLGNNGSQSQSAQAHPPPPPAQNSRQATDPIMQHEINQPHGNREIDRESSPRRSMTSPIQDSSFPNQRAPQSRDGHRSNDQFLTSLMQQTQSPGGEDPPQQQGYNPRTSGDLDSLLSTFISKEPTPHGKVTRGPPPGFFNNDRAFNLNQNLEHSENSNMQSHLPTSREQYDDRSFSPRQQSQMLDEMFRRQQQHQQQPHGPPQFPQHPDLQLRHSQGQPPHPQYDQGPQLPPWLQAQSQSNRPPSQNPHDAVPAPPGFAALPRDTAPPPGFSHRPLPPGFLPQQGYFPPHQQPGQIQPQHQQPPHMRGPPPQHMQQGPPGFAFPPPGYGPGPGQGQQQQGYNQQQHQPQGVNGNGLRRVQTQSQQQGHSQGQQGPLSAGGPGGPGGPGGYGMGPPQQPPQGQYAQYLKQGGGMGAYGGM